ncbi:hypothetical protein [Actinoplanes sp. NPDC051851]|uniref:hypothetical protein n=1 Tax=Actinoplanes sp. NPDC051851 TaxID=3154753 RepID=UPI00343BD258
MRKTLAAMVVLTLVAAGTPQRAGAAPSLHPLPPLPATAYIGTPNSGPGFSVLNLRDGTQTTVAAAGTYSYARASAVAPDLPLAYLFGSDVVQVLDRSTNVVTGTITIPGGGLVLDAAVSPDGQWLYCVDDDNDLLHILDAHQQSYVTSVAVPANPSSVAVSRDGGRVYVGSWASQDVAVIDTVTNQPIAGSPFAAGGAVSGLVPTPTGSGMLAAVPNLGQVIRFDTVTNAVASALTVPGGGQPYWIFFSPEGAWLYAIGSSGEVWRFAAGTYAFTASVETGAVATYRGAVNPNGTTIYLAVPPGNQILPVDLTTGSGALLGTVGTATVLGSYPYDIVIGGDMEPAPPVITAGTVSSGQAVLNFTDGADGGQQITGHTAAWSGGTQSCPASPCTVTGVSGTSVPFTLHATNVMGDSLESASFTATAGAPARSVPDAPVITSAVAGDRQVTLRFRDGSGNGSAITGHFANFSGGPVFCPSSPCVITGLTNGTGYTFTVQAVNAAGNSVASDPTDVVTPSRLPGAPTIRELRPVATGVTVVFTAPASDTPILRYQFQADGGAWADLSGSTIPGLAPGNHSIRLRAVNSGGAGPSSTAVWVTVPVTTVKPAAVAAPTVVAGVSSVKVAWKKSVSEGVTGYTVRANPGPATCTTTATDTDCVIGGTAGRSYTYTVVVRGQGGAVSDASKPSKAVTPAVPGLPSTLPTDVQAGLTTSNGKITSAVRGQKLTLTGSGFAAYSTVRIVIYGKARLLATATADAQGRITQQITLPTELATDKRHSLMAAGVDPAARTRRISMTFNVKA